MGCRNIYHLSTSEHLEIGKERKKGFVEALRKQGIEVRREQILQCDTIADARDLIPELFSLANPPDGIFAVNDLTAAETMIIAKEHGIKIPEDLAIVGFTNGQIAQLTDPRLSSVEQFGYNIGREAVKMLIKRLETVPNDYPVETKVIKTKLVVKGSSLRRGN
jgi:DNA-binding LacI/PurR family transcriptional regulator